MKVMGADSRGSADWIGEVASSTVLETSFAWLCKRRTDYADGADVWNVRRRWPELKLQLQHDLLHGRSRFSPLRRIQIDGEFIELWAARWLDLCPLHGRLADFSSHAMEPAAGHSDRQRNTSGTAGGATPGQNVHRADQAGIHVSRVLDYGERRDRGCAFSLGRISRTYGSAL
jgi:hypothetical protein